MNFDIPQDMQEYLQELDDFIEKEILPLQMENDNNRFFDHRREDARTDWERGGLPNEEWEHLHRNFHRALLSGCRSRWMLQFCDQLFEQTDRYRRIAVVASYPQRDELAEHSAIKDAAIDREAAEAVRLLHAHYKRTGKIIADSLSDAV